MVKRIYIAGKITGEPIVNAYIKFARVDVLLLLRFKSETRGGYVFLPDVINPLALPGIHFGISHEEALTICLKALSKCTHAYFLKDWKDSPGARIEHQFCIDNKIEIIYE